ncbi:MAG: ComF family protein [Bacteroidota bacterium]
MTKRNPWWYAPDDFLSLFYPRLCLACGKNLHSNEEIICLFCAYKLPKTNFHKYRENPLTRHFWGRVNISSGAAMYYFNKGGKVQQLIHRLKYLNKPNIGVKLGEIYGQHLKKSEWMMQPEVIIPVPLHPWKLKKRGYNQSLTFANGLASIMEKPVSKAMRRKTMTRTQTAKSRLERFNNVLEAFEVTNPEAVEGLHVLLVDDVITTGATLEACAIKLLEVPGVKVSVVTIAFAMMR